MPHGIHSRTVGPPGDRYAEEPAKVAYLQQLEENFRSAARGARRGAISALPLTPALLGVGIRRMVRWCPTANVR